MFQNKKTKIIILILFLTSLFLISGCAQQITCNKPYILVGTECCLDNDNNGICDKDELKEEELVEETVEEEVEKPEADEELEEEKLIEQTKQTYAVNDLKANLDKVFWKKNKIWSLMNESSNENVSFYKYGYDDLIIAESHDLNKYTFGDFLNETFFVLIKDKYTQPKNLVDSNSYFKEIELSSLNLKDKREYWIYDNNILTSHSLNYKCNPNLFVRVIPDWTFESTETRGSKIVGLEIGFDSSTKKIISEVYKTTINCPLAKKYVNKIYELQNKLNNELGVDYPFEVKSMEDGTISHISIDDDNSIKVYNEITRKYHQQTYKYKKIIIDELGKRIDTIEDLKGTLEIHSKEDEKMLETNEEKKEIGFKNSRFGEINNISKNTTINFNEINIIDQETIEILKGTFDEYDVEYINSAYRDYVLLKHYVNLNLIHKVLFKCKGDIIISAYSNSIDYIYNEYSEKNVDNSIKTSRNNLLKDIAGIKRVCESLP